MTQLPSRECQRCRSTCRVVPIQHRDGGVDVEGYYCEHLGCELQGRNQFHYGTPGFHETSFGRDWTARYTAFGAPDEGEANVHATSAVFVAVLRRDFRLTIGEPEIVSQTDDDRVDARAPWASGDHLLMQVTRALRGGDYEAQSKRREIERSRRALESVELLRAAIERKRKRARRDITLLIDGREAVDLALPAPTFFVREYGDWARTEGWQSIWSVGPSFAKRLDWSPSEALPPSWPRQS